ISIAAFLLNMQMVANILFWLNSIAFPVLLGLFIIRTILHFDLVKNELMDHQKGPTFFTIIAATCIYGNQVLLLYHQMLIAKILLLFAIGCWLFIIYTFFTFLTIKKEKPPIEKGISGAWLIVVVATQAIAILILLIAPSLSALKEVTLFVALGLYLLGCS